MSFNADEYSPYPSLTGKWVGPVCAAIGVLLIGTQVYAWRAVGVLSWKLSGVGVGLLIVGAIAIFYSFDDKRSARSPVEDELEPEWLSHDDDDNGESA